MGQCRSSQIGKRILWRTGIFLVGIITMFKLGSAAAMLSTMLVSLAIYAWAFGWKFAVGLVILLFVHELGHVIAAVIVGLGPSTPLFVPFIGAVISLNQPPHNAKMAANIAIGGPAFGTLSALIFLLGYLWTDSMLMLVLAYTACIVNLFNLIPYGLLDGGRIAAAIWPRMWWWWAALAGGLFFYTHNFFLLVILTISLYHLWRGGQVKYDERYYDLSLRQRIRVACWYFGLVTMLGILTIYVINLLK
ncbi:MAG: hypothetical protein H6Q74_2663 [Firmicutes bacterium]|nr:hypothetical protein [Bacillota bacterium]